MKIATLLIALMLAATSFSALAADAPNPAGPAAGGLTAGTVAIVSGLVVAVGVGVAAGSGGGKGNTGTTGTTGTIK